MYVKICNICIYIILYRMLFRLEFWAKLEKKIGHPNNNPPLGLSATGPKTRQEVCFGRVVLFGGSFCL